jgi:dihydrodipicolinate reductase
MTSINVVVHGVLGKMGQEVLNAVCGADDLTPVGGADFAASDDDSIVTNNSLKIPVSNDLGKVISNANVVVDFTNADGV